MALHYRPQLATLVKEPPEGEEWLHEVKYDGYRIGCAIDGERVTLWSRRGNDWTREFAEIAAAARRLRVRRALIDGEAAVLTPDGRTSFQMLQNWLAGERKGELAYFAFDLLALDGRDLAPRPLEERKAEALQSVGAARFTTRYAKAGRERKILLDYLRNNRTNTSVAAWSPRTRDGAPVSVPVAWEELTPRLDPGRFTIATVPRRQREDPWKDYWKLRQRLSVSALRAAAAL